MAVVLLEYPKPDHQRKILAIDFLYHEATLK